MRMPDVWHLQLSEATGFERRPRNRRDQHRLLHCQGIGRVGAGCVRSFAAGVRGLDAACCPAANPGGHPSGCHQRCSRLRQRGVSPGTQGSDGVILNAQRRHSACPKLDELRGLRAYLCLLSRAGTGRGVLGPGPLRVRNTPARSGQSTLFGRNHFMQHGHTKHAPARRFPPELVPPDLPARS